MIRRPPRSTRTDTLFPYTTLFRADVQLLIQLHHVILGAGLGNRVGARRSGCVKIATLRGNAVVLQVRVAGVEERRVGELALFAPADANAAGAAHAGVGVLHKLLRLPVLVVHSVVGAHAGVFWG